MLLGSFDTEGAGECVGQGRVPMFSAAQARELAQRVLGVGPRLRGLDDELLIGLGVRSERVPGPE